MSNNSSSEPTSGQNGKGDKWRTTNFPVYWDNFGEINWSSKHKSETKEPSKVENGNINR